MTELLLLLEGVPSDGGTDVGFLEHIASRLAGSPGLRSPDAILKEMHELDRVVARLRSIAERIRGRDLVDAVREFDDEILRNAEPAEFHACARCKKENAFIMQPAYAGDEEGFIWLCFPCWKGVQEAERACRGARVPK